MAAVPALLVTHADLGSALLRAATRVTGDVESLFVVSNDGMSRDQLEDEIDHHVALWEHGGLILADFWGGSCHLCGIAAARGHGDVVVVTGLNLPMLLDYIYNREKHGPRELAERLQQKGRDSIRLHHDQTA